MNIAFDKIKTVRSIDDYGRMHVAMCNISKATVNEYLGSELTGGEQLGLEPNKVYRILRDPAELEKAASTFNNIPLLNRHIAVSADKPEKEAIVGTTGTDAVFKHPYLSNSLTVWDANAIASIEDDSARELSCSYWWDADMQTGVYEGLQYDGIMRNIRGNHVALVAAGRAGSDVFVADSILINKNEDLTVKRNLTGRLVGVAVTAAYGKKLLAADSKFNIDNYTKGISAKRWVIEKPVLAAKLHKILGADASIEDLNALLDGLDTDVVAMNDEESPPATPPATPSEKDVVTKDADPHAAILEFLTSKGVPADVVAAVKDMLGKEEAEEMAMDDEGEGKEDKPNMASDGKLNGYVSVAQMQNAIKASTTSAVAAVRNMNEAISDVKPYVGEMNLAFDSANDVYKAALDMLNIDVTGVHPSAFKAILNAQPKPGQRNTASDSKVDLNWLTEITGGHTVRVI